MVGGGGWWWLRPILVFSLSLDQAEQQFNNHQMVEHVEHETTFEKGMKQD